MEQTIERVKKIVAGYKPAQPGNELKTMRALLAAVNGCFQYIEANAQSDRGCAQRIVRELHEALIELPTFRAMVADRSALNKLHTRKLAEGQLTFIQDQLRKIVKEQEHEKADEIRDWVRQHPALGPLCEMLSKPLPKTAYILLFRRNRDSVIELVTNRTDDGRVYTRLRAQEFKDPFHVQKAFSRASIVGAAVINEKELLGVFGDVPQAEEGKDQLQALLAVSNEAASKPARDFLEANLVLAQLHKLSRDRKVPKEAYILLFEGRSDVSDSTTESEEAAVDEAATEPATDEAITEAATDEAATEAAAADETVEPTAGIAQGDSAVPTDCDETSADEAVGDETSVDETPAGETEPTADETSADETPADETVETAPCIAPAAPVQIIVKTGNDGKVFSRFWPTEFAIKYKVFESWSKKPPVLGAAVVHGDQLLHAFGSLPQPREGQSQLEAVLEASFAAIDRPHVEYVEEHPVLGALYKLAHSDDYKRRHVDAVLFTIAENGAVAPLRLGGKNRDRSARVPLFQFQNARQLHERFAAKNVVGASVLSESEKPEHDRDRRGPRGPRKDEGQHRKQEGPRRGDADRQPRSKPVVLAAFGRTPLKVNVLATPETFRRLGFEID